MESAIASVSEARRARGATPGLVKDVSSGRSRVYFAVVTARLKSCPDKTFLRCNYFAFEFAGSGFREASAATARIPQITASEIPFGIVNFSERSIFVPTKARTGLGLGGCSGSAGGCGLTRNIDCAGPGWRRRLRNTAMNGSRVIARTAGMESTAKTISLSSTAIRASSSGVA